MKRREQLKEFFVTFAANHYPHPYGREVHPDGYVVIEAPEERLAREAAFNIYGQYWSFIYDEKPEERFAPRGELKRWVVFGPIEAEELENENE